jgi:hypothetical protein
LEIVEIVDIPIGGSFTAKKANKRLTGINPFGESKACSQWNGIDALIRFHSCFSETEKSSNLGVLRRRSSQSAVRTIRSMSSTLCPVA